MASAIEDCIPHLVPSLPRLHQPLSLPHILSSYPNIPTFREWDKLLCGINLLPPHLNVPPSERSVPRSLSLDLSQIQHLSETPYHTISSHFDCDSILFSPSSLSVFRQEVSLSFLPAFTRGFSGNQHISFLDVNMRHDKNVLFCVQGSFDCHIFFPNMPHEYTNADGKRVISRTQHLDHYVLGLWMDRVLLPSLSAVCDIPTRAHYPQSFAEIITKNAVNSEATESGSVSRVDIRKFFRARLLGPLWQSITTLAQSITNTHLPNNAFASPVLVVAGHNLKSGDLGGHTSFSSLKSTFQEYYLARWVEDFINPRQFYIDLGVEHASDQPGTTTLRKSTCNNAWATNFRDPSGTQRFTATHFTWAGTDAGSVSVELGTRNVLRESGLAYCKAYNTIKEQFYTPIRGHIPFGNARLELLAFSKHFLEQWRSQLQTNNGSSKLGASLSTLVRQWEQTKQRLRAALIGEFADTPSYCDRQEFRETLELFRNTPDNAFSELQRDAGSASPDPNTHRPFWILSTRDVNQFRAAECNRWIYCMESIMQAAASSPNVQEQELNALMSTAMARTLKLSLGCLSPPQMPSLWHGKRWSRPKSERTLGGVGRRPGSRRKEKRQGLEYRTSVQNHGIIWIPSRLGQWNGTIPLFRHSKYPHLDVYANVFRYRTRGLRPSDQRTRDGRFEEFIATRIRETAEETQDFTSQKWLTVFTMFSQVCIQKYNAHVWDVIHRRWCQDNNIRLRSKRDVFVDHAGLRPDTIQGFDVLCYTRIRKVIRLNLGEEDILHARVQDHARSSFTAWTDGSWLGRLKPLFTLEGGGGEQNEAPQWLRKSAHWKTMVMLGEQFRRCMHPTLTRSCLEHFQWALYRNVNVYVQAILHYTADNQSTMATASASNSQQMQALRKSQGMVGRTKWMFPRLRTKDVPTWELGVREVHTKRALRAEETRGILKRLQVFTTKDTSSLKDDRHLMRAGGEAGGSRFGELRYAKELGQDFETWLDIGTMQDDSEDSDWPCRDDIDDWSSDSSDNSSESE